MNAPGQCLNCRAALPADQPQDHGYCETCAAAWQKGNPPHDQVVGDAESVSGRCANCGAALPADQPQDHGYCETCAAAWQKGNPPR
jgi:hypothetical protein